MKYVPSTTLAATVEALRQWIITELQRLSIILRNEDTAFDTKIEVVGANATAALTAESTARVTADAALSASVNTISATVSGQTAAIQTVQLAVAAVEDDVTNLNAQYGVTVSAGKVTGFKLNSSPTTSEFIVQADKFAVGSGGSYPFEIIGGTTYIKDAVIPTLSATKITIDGLTLTNSGGALAISNGGVDTAKIATNAVSTSTFAQSSGALTPTGGAVTVQSVTVTTAGGPVLVQFSMAGYAQSNGAGAYGYEVTMYRNGNPLRSTMIFQATATATGQRLPFMFTCPIMDTPAAGTHTYSFDVNVSGGVTAGVNVSTHRAIDARELKR